MANPFGELRERLLRAGVAPRHVRRYLAELADHLADLRAEEERAGRRGANAEATALARLGGVDDLAEAMIEQRQFQSLCGKAPWAIFGIVPLVLLAGAYLVAGLILWSGWQIFLPGAETPFVGRLHGLAVYYFGVGRLAYFSAPILIGWGIGLVAARQRSKAIWPIAGLILIALIAGAAQFHAVRPHLPGAAGHVSVGFAFDDTSGDLIRAFAILLLTMSPYLIWRLGNALSPNRPTA